MYMYYNSEARDCGTPLMPRFHTMQEGALPLAVLEILNITVFYKVNFKAF